MTDDSSGRFHLADETVRLKVKCASCGRQVGRVFRTPLGHLWWGQLTNDEARHARRRRPEALLQYAVPALMSPPSDYYVGECRCGRGAADGNAIHKALAAGRRQVAVPFRPVGAAPCG